MARGRKINAPAVSSEDGRPLKDEVRDALLAAMREPAAPGAAAVVAAARTLLEYYGDEGKHAEKPIEAMALADIEAELARGGRKRAG